MATNDQIYLDEFYIGTNVVTGDPVSGPVNFLTDVDDTDVSKDDGYPWLVQITNKHETSGWEGTLYMLMCIKYKSNNVFGNYETYDLIYTFSNFGLSELQSKYIGYDGTSNVIPSGLNTGFLIRPDGVSPGNTGVRLLPDQKEGANIIAASEITILTNDGGGDLSTDAIGNNNLVGGIPGSSAFYYIHGSIEGDFGILRRDPVVLPFVPAGQFFNPDTWEVVDVDTNSLNNSRLNASAAGDPHITTVNGVYYKFDYLGSFRLYEDNNLIINGMSEIGDSDRWKDKQYIRKVFIQYNDKSILLDTGFRGSPVKVLENNGIKYTDEQLEFNNNAEVNCWVCRKTYYINEEGNINRHRNKYKHKILEPVRNKITISFDNYLIEITNINEFNLQPCRVDFKKLDKDYTNSKGCIIERKYVGVSILDDIRDTEKMRDIEDETENWNLVEEYSTKDYSLTINPRFI